MKKLIVTTAVLILFLMAVTSVLATPRMTLPETEFNFGYAPQNSKLSHVFWVHSTGDEMLKILKVVPG